MAGLEAQYAAAPLREVDPVHWLGHVLQGRDAHWPPRPGGCDMTDEDRARITETLAETADLERRADEKIVELVEWYHRAKSDLDPDDVAEPEEAAYDGEGPEPPTNDTHISPYEQLRKQNIEKHRQFRLSIGLSK